MQKLIYSLFLMLYCNLSLFSNSFLNNVTLQISALEDAECFEEASGYVELEAISGILPYTFSMAGMTNTSGVFEDLVAGTYTAMVTDQSGCSASMTIDIEEPNQLVLSVMNLNDTGCLGVNNGSFEIVASGGTGNYSYTLDNNTNMSGVFENLTVGVYDVFVEDENGCESFIVVTIAEGIGVSVLLIEQIDIDCFGNNTGQIQVEGQNGVSPYQYRIGADVNTSGVFSNLLPGEYSILVSDEVGCSATMEVTINEPEELITDVLMLSNISCVGANDGSFQISASGGVGGFNYSVGQQNNMTGVFENLPPATYTILISDANGCAATEEIIIEEAAEIEAFLTEVNQVSCHGGNDGLFLVVGVGDYSYTVGEETNTDGLFENLFVGEYSIEVMDENGCVINLELSIFEPSILIATIIDLQNLGCNMALGTVEIEANGGTGNYSYTLDTEVNTTGLFENLQVGNYQVEIEDENGCVTTVNFGIEAVEDLVGMIQSQGNVGCFGENTGFVELMATGGNGNYTYVLGDESNVLGEFNNLAADVYEVEIFDTDGCSTIISFVIEQANEIVFNFQFNLPTCFDGEDGIIEIFASGGTGMLLYSLNGETNTTGVFEGLTGGDHDIIISDNNDCLVETTFSLAVPEQLVLSVVDIQPDTGNGSGSFNIQGGGGTSPYIFSLDGVDFSPNPPFSNLASGDYTAYIMDANGCVTFVEVTIPFMSNTYGVETGVAAMSVFPNPFSEVVNLELDLYLGQNLTFTFYTIRGVEVQKSNRYFPAGASLFILEPLDELSAGTYFLQVKGASFQGYFKMIKK